MPFNSLLGAGREPRVAGTPSQVSISSSSMSLNAGASPPNVEVTANIEGEVQIFTIAVSVTPFRRDQTSTNAKLNIVLDGNTIATYQLPDSQSLADPVTWFVNETIPWTYLTRGSGSSATATLSADNGGTTGYIISTRIIINGIFV